MTKQMQIIVARLSILATLQLLGFIGSFGILNASASGTTFTQTLAQIMRPNDNSSELQGQVLPEIQITGFSPVEENNCGPNPVVDCEMLVHYDLSQLESNLNKDIQVKSYLTGPDMNNMEIGNDTIQNLSTESETSFTKKIAPKSSGYYNVKVVVLDSTDDFAILSSDQSSFYTSAQSAGRMNIELASFTESDIQREKDKLKPKPVLRRATPTKPATRVARVQTPVKTITPQEEIIGSSTKTVSKQITQQSESLFRYTYTKKQPTQLKTQSTQPTVIFRDTDSKTTTTSRLPTPIPTP